MPVLRINAFHAPEGQGPGLQAFLAGVIDIIRDAPGCVDVELLIDDADPARLTIVERWMDVAAHQAAAGRIPPELMAQVKPLLAEPPKGRYCTPV